MDNETIFKMLEDAIDHEKRSTWYWDNDYYLYSERAINTLIEAHLAIGPYGQIPSWERN